MESGGPPKVGEGGCKKKQAKRAAAGHYALRSHGVHHEVNAAELVDEQIAGDARPVVAVISPAKQADWFKRPLGRVAQEAIPVDILRRGVWWNGVLPRA